MRALAGIGATIAPNTYRWLAALPELEETLRAERVMVGSAMVSDGFVRRDDYLAWVTSVATKGPVDYLPHRRERREDLAAIADIAGVTVHRPGIPLELLLAASPTVRSVTTLPSSVVATLKRALASTVFLDVHDVPDGWWTDRAAPAFRSMLTAARVATPVL